MLSMKKGGKYYEKRIFAQLRTAFAGMDEELLTDILGARII